MEAQYEPLELITTDELLELKPPEWLVEDFIAEKSTTMIYGKWGLGKSFMMLDMALSATVGGTWEAGNDRQILRPLKTLYVVAEGVHWWPVRVRAYEKYTGVVTDRDNILWYPRPLQLYDPSPATVTTDMHRLKASVEKHEPDMVVFDTLARCASAFGMNENDAASTATMFRHLDGLRDEFGVTPVLIHHPGKGPSGTLRGSGNLGGSVERVVKLGELGSKDRTQFYVEDEKGNHTTPFDTFAMRFHSVELDDGSSSAKLVYNGLYDPDGKSDKGLTAGDKMLGWLAIQSEPKSREEINDALSVGNKFDSAMTKLVNSGAVLRTGEPRRYRWEKT